MLQLTPSFIPNQHIELPGPPVPPPRLKCPPGPGKQRALSHTASITAFYLPNLQRSIAAWYARLIAPQHITPWCMQASAPSVWRRRCSHVSSATFRIMCACNARSSVCVAQDTLDDSDYECVECVEIPRDVVGTIVQHTDRKSVAGLRLLCKVGHGPCLNPSPRATPTHRTATLTTPPRARPRRLGASTWTPPSATSSSARGPPSRRSWRSSACSAAASCAPRRWCRSRTWR
jgi:hypothetical protein